MHPPAARCNAMSMLSAIHHAWRSRALLVLATIVMMGTVVAEAQRTETVTAIVQDFSASHPDFQPAGRGSRLDEDIVGAQLGDDGTPVYAGGRNGTRTTTGPESFFDWYHDTNANIRFHIDLALDVSNGYRSFDPGEQFLPIDGRGFGNEGEPHNFLFTTAIHMTFTYWRGRPEIVVQCDDDCFVYVNGYLVINGGGIHSAIEYRVDLNDVAQQLELVEGEAYPIDLFHAERNPNASRLRFRVPGFEPPPTPPMEGLGGTLSGMHIDAITVTCLNATTGARADYITVEPIFHCRDFGFEAQPGDVVIINVLGNGIAQ